MNRILLIEDTGIQRRHAKNQIEGYDLTFAQTKKVVPEMEEFDLVLTDLQLPSAAGEQPSIKVGGRIFCEAFQLLQDGKLQGVALVSNYEHHVDDQEVNDELSSVEGIAEAKESSHFLYSTKATEEGEQGEIGLRWHENWLPLLSEERGELKKSVILLDMSLFGYKHFVTPDGEIVESASLPDDLWTLLTGGDYRPAKPWGEVVEALEELQDE